MHAKTAPRPSISLATAVRADIAAGKSPQEIAELRSWTLNRLIAELSSRREANLVRYCGGAVPR